MFTIKKQPFGTFEKYTFADKKGNAMEIVPACGANLLDLRFDGLSVLDGYRTPKELKAMAWAKSAVLVPFPNRLRDGKYNFLNVNYQLPLNHPASGNAIHGFGKDAKMKVIKAWATETEAGLYCRWHYKGELTGYPFRFTFETTQILREGGDFEMTMLIRNRHNSPIPVGLGCHHYFVLSDKVDDTSLQLPDCQQIILDSERMLPTGEKRQFDDFKDLTPLSQTALDHGFVLNDQQKGVVEVILTSNRGRMTYWQEKGKGRFNYIQVFTPPHRQSIAVEPMTCAGNAFNSGDGLVVLQQRHSLRGTFGVRFEKA
jgi:aldose 1-epimerase